MAKSRLAREWAERSNWSFVEIIFGDEIKKHGSQKFRMVRAPKMNAFKYEGSMAPPPGLDTVRFLSQTRGLLDEAKVYFGSEPWNKDFLAKS